MSTRHLFALLALTFTTACLGQQQVPPTDADYHAAYCIPLLDEEIKFLQTAVTKLHAHTKNAHQAGSPEFSRLRQRHDAQWQGTLGRLEKARERLSAYFIPRWAALDLRSRWEANLAAQMDWADFAMNSVHCEEEWPFNQGGPLRVHMTSCINASLVARVQSCRNLTWLPRVL